MRLRDRLSLKTLFRQSDWPPHPHPSLHTHSHTFALHIKLYPNCQKLSTSKRATLIRDSHSLSPHEAALMVLDQDLLSSAEQLKAKDGGRSAFGASKKRKHCRYLALCDCVMSPRPWICHEYIYVYSVMKKRMSFFLHDLARGGRVAAKFSFHPPCCSPSFAPLLVRNGETPQLLSVVVCSASGYGVTLRTGSLPPVLPLPLKPTRFYFF